MKLSFNLERQNHPWWITHSLCKLSLHFQICLAPWRGGGEIHNIHAQNDVSLKQKNSTNLLPNCQEDILLPTLPYKSGLGLANLEKCVLLPVSHHKPKKQSSVADSSPT